jgi:hypothetical protein
MFPKSKISSYLASPSRYLPTLGRQTQDRTLRTKPSKTFKLPKTSNQQNHTNHRDTGKIRFYVPEQEVTRLNKPNMKNYKKNYMYRLPRQLTLPYLGRQHRTSQTIPGKMPQAKVKAMYHLSPHQEQEWHRILCPLAVVPNILYSFLLSPCNYT